MSRRGGKNKFSPQFERDYTFYLSNKYNFTFPGSYIKRDYGIQFDGDKEIIIPFSIPFSNKGKSAKVCFFSLDSTGKSKPCSEPELLVEILTCKAAVNLQIKIWSQSRAECTISLSEIREYMDFYQAPDWVLKAIENQKLKIIKEWVAEKKYESNYYKRILADHMVEFLKETSKEILRPDVILDENKTYNIQEINND
ncbi:MAG TPA: hypothetical protein VII94_05630 [Candidatus Saccharimonadales bacterium]